MFFVISDMSDSSMVGRDEVVADLVSVQPSSVVVVNNNNNSNCYEEESTAAEETATEVIQESVVLLEGEEISNSPLSNVLLEDDDDDDVEGTLTTTTITDDVIMHEKSPSKSDSNSLFTTSQIEGITSGNENAEEVNAQSRITSTEDDIPSKEEVFEELSEGGESDLIMMAGQDDEVEQGTPVEDEIENNVTSFSPPSK